MSLSIYNPCEDGIPAKIWELLRRNEAFQKKTKELNNLQGKEGRWEKFMFVNNERHYYAATAWNWMYKPVIIQSELGPKRGQPQRVGPRITDDRALKEYEEDEKKGRTPLKLDSPWPNTPRGFRKAYSDCWADYTADVHEIVPSGLYPNEDAIPPGIEIAPELPSEADQQTAIDINKRLWDAAGLWHWIVETNRVFAVPRVFSMRGKNSRNKIIKLIAEKLEEDSPPPKVQLFGTEAQWRLFLFVESFRKSDSLSRGAAIEKTIEALGYGKDLDPVTRRNRYYSRIEGQVQAIDNSNEKCPDQDGWIQFVYPNVYSITEIIKIAREKGDSPVRQ